MARKKKKARRKRKPLSIHNERWRIIKPFVRFRFDGRTNLKDNLTASDKAKLKRYFDEIDEGMAQPHDVVTLHSERQFKAAAKIAGTNTRLQELKRKVLIPSDGKHKVKLTFETVDGEFTATAKSRFVQETEQDFNKAALARDPDKEIMRVADLQPKARSFKIRVGEKFEIPAVIDRKLLPGAVRLFIERYSPSKADPSILNSGDKAKDHHWNQWMTGLIGAKFKNQASIKAYLKQSDRAKQQLARDRAAGRKRQKKQFGRKL